MGGKLLSRSEPGAGAVLDASRTVHPERSAPIDLDDDTRMLMLTALSGKGFKFCPAFGELAADLVTGKSNNLYDAGFSLGGAEPMTEYLGTQVAHEVLLLLS
ncbi:MAG: hypothetical protein SW127_13860 [Actinomycetota bacterium]|nr:hypothetical protein [Actinomycetota bacterium]